MSALLSQVLPPLKIQLSPSEAFQIKNTQSKLLQPPELVSLTNAGLKNARNNYYMTNALPIIQENLLKKHVHALISEYNHLYKLDHRNARIAQIDSNIAYLITFYRYLKNTLTNDIDIKNIFFILLKTISIAKIYFPYTNQSFLPLSASLRLINASLTTILNHNALTKYAKLPFYCTYIRNFLKDRTLNNSAILTSLVLPRHNNISQFTLSATANLQILNAESGGR